MQIDTVVCGDCLDVMAEMPDGSVDLVVTSPPYDILRTCYEYIFDFKGIARELYRITKQHGIVVWVVGDETKDFCESLSSFKQAIFFVDICGFNLLDTMIYLKNGGPSPYPGLRRYPGWFEYMFVFAKGRPATFNPIKDRQNVRNRIEKSTARQRDGTTKNAGRYRGKKMGMRPNYWLCSPQKNRVNHPGALPEILARDHILSWSDVGNVIFDPMIGSGTTAVAALKLGRHFYGCDISPEYVKLANERIAKARLEMSQIEMELAS